MAIYTDIFNEVDTVLTTYVFSTSSTVITNVTPLFTSLLIIWIGIWGILLMFGKSEATLQEAFFRILRIGFIFTLGLSIGTYSAVVVDFIFGWPEEIVGWITGNPSSNLAATIDLLMDSMIAIVTSAWKKAGIFDGNFGYYLIALIVGGFAVVISVTLAFLILLSKIILSVLLAVGPIFIILLLFNTTQKFFESWLAALMNYGFLLLLSVLVALLIISVINTIVAGLGTPDTIATVYGAMKVSIILLLSTLVLRQTPQLAANLGGGIAIQTAGAFSSAVNQSRNFSRFSGLNMTTLASGRGVRSLAGKAYQKAFSPSLRRN